MYEETTEGVRIRVTPAYVPAESAPADNKYFWAYTIEITNLSARTVKLVNRYWRIVDAAGNENEVRGDGVVGSSPRSSRARRSPIRAVARFRRRPA